MPLFEFYSHYRQYQNRNSRLYLDWDFVRTVLVSEWRKEVRLIPRIAVIITTRCTLKCRHCSGLFPYFKIKEDIDYRAVISDIKAIECKTNKIYCLELVGGETFLHPHLDAILDYAIKSSKIGYIELATNAVVKIQGSVLRRLRNTKVLVKISDYGFNKKNIISMTKLFEKMSIRYVILNEEKWQDYGYPMDYKESRLKIEKKFDECSASALCRTLFKGNLMMCGRGPFLCMSENLSVKSVKVHSPSFSAKMLNEFYRSKEYIICQYCNFNHKSVIGGVQIENITEI